jgi:ferrous iron transport protein A
MTLAEAPAKATVKVTRLRGAAPVTRRLLEMGLTPGCELTVVRVAPLGDPIEVSLRGYRLSLRKADTACVEVTVPAGVETAAGGQVASPRSVV